MTTKPKKQKLESFCDKSSRISPLKIPPSTASTIINTYLNNAFLVDDHIYNTMVKEIFKTQQLSKSVNKKNQILEGTYSHISWIRCEGKGSFSISPLMKQAAECHIEAGGNCIVIDLEDCTSMDSTFMGTMAGIAMKLAKIPNGTLQVIDANYRNKSSLEDLGLCMLLEVAPKNPEWNADIEKMRASLKVCTKASCGDSKQHVLEAHKILCEADENNDEKFSTVLDVLEAELNNLNNN